MSALEYQIEFILKPLKLNEIILFFHELCSFSRSLISNGFRVASVRKTQNFSTPGFLQPP